MKRYALYRTGGSILTHTAVRTRRDPSGLHGELVGGARSSRRQRPLVVGIDETLERRRGKKIVAKGIYRDPAKLAFQPLPLRQDERPKMGVRNAFGGGPVGFEGLGFAVSV